MSVQNLPADNVEIYAALWTTDKDDYVLVQVKLPDGRLYHDLYRRDGTYSTLPNEHLNEVVAQRMLAAGVPVVDADTWVLGQKLHEYEHFWTGAPNTFVVVRYTMIGEQSLAEIIYGEDGTPYSIHDAPIRQAVIERMLAAGVELIECEEPLPTEAETTTRDGNARVAAEWDDAELEAACVMRLLIQPSFSPWHSWRLLQSRHDNGTASYRAQFLTWRSESPLPFRERLRLPASEQGWRLTFIREDVALDSACVEVLLQRLSQIRIPAYVDRLLGGRDGTTYRFTVGDWPYQAEWAWWENGPQEWSELVEFTTQMCHEFALRRQTHPCR